MPPETEPRQKRRQRQTIVCEFCRKRKVKCDKGNPCGTCQKYGNKYCHYADNSSAFAHPSSVALSKNGVVSISPASISATNGSSTANATSSGSESRNANANNNNNSNNNNNANDDLSGEQSELERELEQLKQKIKSIEQSVTSIADDVSPSFGSPSLAPGIPSDSVYGGDSMAMLNRNSMKRSYSDALVDQSGAPLRGALLGKLHTPGAFQGAGSNSGASGDGPLPTIALKCKFNTLLGHNPIASTYDTINFYAGYTAIQDKEPLRRSNFGPLSWVALLRKDQGLSLLWNYIQNRALKDLLDLKEKIFTQSSNVIPGTSETLFQNVLSESFGYNDVRLYNTTKPQEPVVPMEAAGLTSEGGDSLPAEAATPKPMNSDSRPALFPTTSSSTSIKIAKSKINERARSLGISYYAGEIDQQLELAEKIELILPTESVVWLLIDRFFTHLYPFFPIIDEEVFKAQISVIIGNEGYDNKKKIKITVVKRLDFALLGILLVVLRLSYLSLLTTVDSVNERNLTSFDQSPQAQRLRYLLNNPINLEVVDAAQSCLNQFNLLRRINMSIMQLALFTRFYHLYAPEDGDGSDGGDSQVFTGTLVQMAISLGLNREPDQFPDACNDEKVNNIGRKIWYMLVILDMSNSMTVGTPTTINSSMFDTKFPFYRKGNENIKNVEFEKQILSSTFPRVERIYEPLTDIINVVLDVKANVNMAKLAERLNFLETYFIEEYGKLRLYFHEEDTSELKEPPFIKTLKMKIYFQTNFFLVSLFFHFFCFYEKKKNSEYAFYYLKKIFVITIGDLMPYYIELLEKNPNVFRDLTDLIVTPGFECVLHKSFIVSNAILIRIKMIIHSIRLRSDSQPMGDAGVRYLTKLTRMDQLLQKSNKIFLDVISKLSKRYYYAWRIYKAGSYVFDLIRTKDFYEAIAGKNGLDEGGFAAKLMDMKFSTDMLDDLIDLFELSLARVPNCYKKHHELKYHGQAPSLTTGPVANGSGIPNSTNNTSNTNNENTNNNNFSNVQASSPFDLRSRLGTSISDKRPELERSDSVISGGRDHNTVGSTGSSSFSSDNILNDANNEQIDDLWMKVMSIKRGNDIGNSNPNQNFIVPNKGGGPSFDFYSQTPVDTSRFPIPPFTNSGTPMGTFTAGSGSNNLAQNDANQFDSLKALDFDIFQGLSFEDIFQG